MPVLTIFCGKQRQDISVSAGTTLLEGLRQGGFPHVEAPCGGCGRCGRCLVTAVGGLSPAGARERALLSPGETRRLACLARVEGDCTVVLPEGATRVAVEHAATGFPIDRAGRGLGAAADIGTTTVVLYLYDRTPGTLLATASAPNAQRWAGADVISRIRYTMENPGGLAELTGAIRRQLRELLAQACTQAGRAAGEVTALSVAGNTVMEHLLAGLSPAGMAAAPFTPASFFGQAVPAGPYDLGMAPDAELYLFPCISGYVGGDITAGLTAVRAARAERPILFVDVGTNGEMALGGRDGLLCCSTAAGPAFEGACISCGMGASDGAIDKVWLEDGQLRCSVLGGGEPAGVCGSGLVDALAVLLALEVVDETGRLLPADEAPPAWAGRIEPPGWECVAHLRGRAPAPAGQGGGFRRNPDPAGRSWGGTGGAVGLLSGRRLRQLSAAGERGGHRTLSRYPVRQAPCCGEQCRCRVLCRAVVHWSRKVADGDSGAVPLSGALRTAPIQQHLLGLHEL